MKAKRKYDFSEETDYASSWFRTVAEARRVVQGGFLQGKGQWQLFVAVCLAQTRRQRWCSPANGPRSWDEYGRTVPLWATGGQLVGLVQSPLCSSIQKVIAHHLQMETLESPTDDGNTVKLQWSLLDATLAMILIEDLTEAGIWQDACTIKMHD